MKSLLSILILTIAVTTQTFSQNTLEKQIGTMLQQEEVQKYFSGVKTIVLIKNVNCNEAICSPDNIASKKEVKLYSKEEAYMRVVSKYLEITEIESLSAEKRRFTIELYRYKTITIEL